MLTGTNCKWCEAGHSHIYDYSCFKCRERALLDEPCKVLRKYMAENMWRYGEVPDWKREPHCNCNRNCKRQQLTRKTQNANTTYR